MAAIVTLYKTFKDRYGLGSQLIDFVNKLIENPANPSLHVEPVVQAADKRVRTARVTQKYRAVLFELQGTRERQFVLIDVLNHDDAYDFATTKQLSFNHITGVTELKDVEAPISAAVTQEEIESRAKQLAAEKLAQLQAEEEAAKSAAEFAAEEEKAPAVAKPTPATLLKAEGISEEALSDELGLSPLTVGILLTARTVTDVEELLSTHPEWERNAVIGLMAGMSIAEIRADLRLDESRDQAARIEDHESDEAIIEGMKTPAGKMEFIVAPGQEDLESIISGGSFDAWRVYLHPNQQRAVEAQHSGSGRITGGAGTGKTVVVVHRTKHLLDQNPGARVLLTTYTRDLANALKTQMNLLDPDFPEASVHGAPGLWISGVDALVADVIRNSQPLEREKALRDNFGINGTFTPKALDDREERNFWEESVAVKGGDLSPEKAHPTFLSQEYSTVILTHGVTDERSYLRVRRAGRGTPLSRAERKAVWATVEMFHAKCASARKLTFAALAVLAAHIVENRDSVRMFDHVLIDEAQDFHAGHWRFLRACVVEGPNDIFLAEDSHQRIYGQRLVLSHYGIHTRGRASTKLRVNYRTTAQNLGYASAILDGTEWIDSEEEVDDLHGYHSVRRGPAPTILQSTSKSEEAEQVAALIAEWISTAEQDDTEISVGVLTRTRQRMTEISAQLGEHEVPLATGRVTTAERPVSVMTMHNAKGLEFTHVVLADVSADALPQAYLMRGLAEAERDDSLQRERALLYVAASRARDLLVVSTIGEASALLPAEVTA